MAIAKNIAKRTKRRMPWHPKPNVAKRARALGIMRRKGIKPLTKARARAACDAAIETRGRSPGMLDDETRAASDRVNAALQRIRKLN